jgi:hypothetical protein
VAGYNKVRSANLVYQWTEVGRFWNFDDPRLDT